MRTEPLKLVTIIAEAILEERLCGDLRRLGARGYSIGTVRGEGSRGVRATEWEGKNIRIESIVGEDVADAIVTHVATEYFTNFAVIVYVSDVTVVRGSKYT
jgi:nitrogen regulatory protein P-II 2